MRLGFDVIPLLDLPTGIRFYTWELLVRLLASSEIEQVRALVPAGRLQKWKAHFQELATEKVAVRSSLAPLTYLMTLGRKSGWSGPDLPHLFHATHQYFPVPNARLPVVWTIHDLAQIRFPDHYSWFERKVFDACYRYRDRVSRFITVSEFTKRELCELYRILPERVSVIPIAGRPMFRPIPMTDDDRSTLRNTYGLSESYLLCVGQLVRRKNVARLIHVFAGLCRKHRDFPMLVIAGPNGLDTPNVLQAIRDEHIADRVRWLGFVPSSDLVKLYNSALGSVYPSLYEGFGLPVLEAMQCGSPVAASRASSIPEVAGDAAILFDPDSPGEMETSLFRLADRSDVRNDLRDRGFERVRLFSWERCAAQTLKLYGSVVRQSAAASS